MIKKEEHASLVEIQDHLIELYVQQQDAKMAQEEGRICELQIKINDLEAQWDELRHLDT
jgi:hypothetical protein